MSQQLAYVIITPYSLHKSRTGGILSRLITRSGVELAAARMFAPSAELVKQYSQAILSKNDPQDSRIQELLQNYILQNLSPDPKTGRRKSLYEPVHGSAPDIAGKNLANPIAMIASFGMALRYSLGLGEWADKLDQAIAAVLAKGLRTKDIAQGDEAVIGTVDMGNAILGELKALS